jgi:hypothetical protein
MDLRHGPCPSCPPIWRAVRHPVRESRLVLADPAQPACVALAFPFPACQVRVGGVRRQASLRRALCVAACLPARLCEGGSATSLTNQQQPARSSTKARAGQTPIATSPLLCVIQKPPAFIANAPHRCAPLCCRLASGNSWPSNQKLMQFHGDYSPVMFQCLMHILPPCADRALLFPSIEDRRWPDVQAIFIHAVITLLFRRRNSISSNIRYSRLWACGNCCGASVNLPPMSQLES